MSVADGDPAYEGQSQASHVTDLTFSKATTGPLEADPTMQGVSQPVLSDDRSPSQFDLVTLLAPRSPVGGIAPGYYFGVSKAIHVFGTDAATFPPPTPIPACRCCAEGGGATGCSTTTQDWSVDDPGGLGDGPGGNGAWTVDQGFGSVSDGVGSLADAGSPGFGGGQAHVDLDTSLCAPWAIRMEYSYVNGGFFGFVHVGGTTYVASVAINEILLGTAASWPFVGGADFVYSADLDEALTSSGTIQFRVDSDGKVWGRVTRGGADSGWQMLSMSGGGLDGIAFWGGDGADDTPTTASVSSLVVQSSDCDDPTCSAGTTGVSIGGGGGGSSGAGGGGTPSGAIEVTEDNRVLEDLLIQGPMPTGAAFPEDLGAGISAHGADADNMIETLTIRNCTIRGFRFGIICRFVRNLIIENCIIEDADYAGVAIFSCNTGRITNNLIQRIGFVKDPFNGFQENNAYGIMLNRTESSSLSNDPVTKHFLVDHNSVYDVPTWMCYNSHGGDDIQFVLNYGEGAPRGIFVAGSPVSGGGVSEPVAITVDDNVLGRSVTKPGGSTDKSAITYFGWTGKSIQRNQTSVSFDAALTRGGGDTGVTVGGNTTFSGSASPGSAGSGGSVGGTGETTPPEDVGSGTPFDDGDRLIADSWGISTDGHTWTTSATAGSPGAQRSVDGNHLLAQFHQGGQSVLANTDRTGFNPWDSVSYILETRFLVTSLDLTTGFSIGLAPANPQTGRLFAVDIGTGTTQLSSGDGFATTIPPGFWLPMTEYILRVTVVDGAQTAALWEIDAPSFVFEAAAVTPSGVQVDAELNVIVAEVGAVADVDFQIEYIRFNNGVSVTGDCAGDTTTCPPMTAFTDDEVWVVTAGSSYSDGTTGDIVVADHEVTANWTDTSGPHNAGIHATAGFDVPRSMIEAGIRVRMGFTVPDPTPGTIAVETRLRLPGGSDFFVGVGSVSRYRSGIAYVTTNEPPLNYGGPGFAAQYGVSPYNEDPDQPLAVILPAGEIVFEGYDYVPGHYVMDVYSGTGGSGASLNGGPALTRPAVGAFDESVWYDIDGVQHGFVTVNIDVAVFEGGVGSGTVSIDTFTMLDLDGHALNFWCTDVTSGGCDECSDPDTGLQLPPFTPGFMPTFRRQIGDPTTSLDSAICTMESGAMVLDWHTRGAISIWGGELIPWCGRSPSDIAAHGTNLGNVKQAWRHFGQTLDVRSGGGWSGVMAALAEGRAVILQGDYGEFPLSVRCQRNFEDNHAISVYPYQVGDRLLVGDPLCSTFHGVKISTLQAYAEALSPGVLFAVSRPWTP